MEPLRYNTLKEWNLNPFYDVEKNICGPTQEITESTEFLGSGIGDILKISAASNPYPYPYPGQGDLSAEIRNGSMFSLEPITGEVGIGAMFNHSANKSNNPIDLKFEELNDYGEVRTNQSSKESSLLSSPETEVKNNQSLKRNSAKGFPMRSKRNRTTNLHSEVPLCQVQGCNKDLSSSKDYHKRHKVCDEHSKTALVIVNGKEQRFCQQCSRFHLLAEFDEGKRSCRKRLAGHNERRRKPQFDTHWGSRFLDMTSQRRVPFLFPEILPSSFFYQEKYEVNNESKKSLGNSQLAMSFESEQSPTRSIQHQYKTRKQGAMSLVQEFSTGQNSTCALSLLSAHSQNLVHDSMDISRTPPSTPIDLVQLSSHLQRVEQQKNSVQVKQENDIFSSFTST